MKNIVLISILISFSFSCVSQEYIIQNVTILGFHEDGTYNKKENASIHVKNDTINKIYIGKVPDSLSNLCRDFSHHYVVPGLIDAHVHMSLKSYNEEVSIDIDYENYLSNYAESGITTIIDVARPISWTYDREEKHANLFFSGPMFLGEYEKNTLKCSKSLHYCPNDKSEVIELFNELDDEFPFYSNWKFVKIYGFKPTSLIRNEIINQARNRGKKIIEHDKNLKDRLVILSSNELLKPDLYGHTPPVCSNLNFDEMKDYFAHLNSLKISLITTIDVGHTYNDKMCGIDALRMANNEKVPFILGTDNGYHSSHSNKGLLKEYDYICQHLGWVEALKASTFQAAKSLGLEKLGEIRPGYKADMLILYKLPKSGKELLYPCKVFKNGMEINSNPKKCHFQFKF